MGFDLETSGFHSYDDFLAYAEGATVAPASIFATLLLMRRDHDRFRPLLPYDDIRDAVRPAAVACYEVHILRDAREDLAAGRNYFPQSELRAFRLDPRSGLTPAWQPSLRAYGRRVRGGWIPALESLESLEGPMSERERLMLHVLVEFYGESLVKISRLNYDVWSDRHWPEPAEVAALLGRLAGRYEPDADLRELAVRVVEDV
jgi:phytoene/squalene synthetase